jgi:uncharacterized membrane protein HdeD (DUF308 family)
VTVNHQSQAAALWPPVLFRAIIAAAFGALTIFWQEPTMLVLSISGGLYLGLTGFSVLKLRARPEIGNDFTRRMLNVEAIAYLAAGVLVLIFQNQQLFAYIAALGLLGGAVVEIVLGAQQYKRHLLSMDWLITGTVSLVTAAALPIFMGFDPHALLGILGGSAIIVAVVLLLAALSYRHEARSGAAARA